MCGIELSASHFLIHHKSSGAGNSRLPQGSDYTMERCVTLPFIYDASGAQQVNELIEVAPVAFNYLRALPGIQTEDYLQSLGVSSFLGTLMLGSLSFFGHEVSSGKSGSSFFISWDERYLLKRIPERESQTLRRVLPQLARVRTTSLLLCHKLTIQTL